MSDTAEWEDIGFPVVSDVTSGTARGVWLIFDLWPYDPVSTDRYHVQYHVNWGWLLKHEGDEDENDVRFFTAKIADYLGESGRGLGVETGAQVDS